MILKIRKQKKRKDPRECDRWAAFSPAQDNERKEDRQKNSQVIKGCPERSHNEK